MPERHHIIFCGTPEFAVPSLEALITHPSFTIDLVITQPDKPVGRKQTVTPPPVKVIAEKHGIPVFQPKNINKELPSALHSQFSIFNFQFLVVVAYGQILSKEILGLPVIAPVNVHASLLPRWRGASPIEHAIFAGDHETGITIQRMVSELDAGPILAQERTAIDARETAEKLRRNLARMGADLLVHTLTHPLHPVAQPTEGVTFCRKLSRKEGQVDARTMRAEEIDRHVRALNPWPGVVCDVKGQSLKLIETSLKSEPDAYPLPCRDGTTLHLITVQSPGKKPMSGSAWAHGKH